MREQFFFLNFSILASELDHKRGQLDFTTYLTREFNLPKVDEQNNPISWSIALTDFLISAEGEEIEAKGESKIKIENHQEEKGDTEVSLGEKSFFSIDKYPYVVLTDIVGESYLRGRFLPILRIFYPDVNEVTPLITPYYIPLNTNAFNSIRIYFFKEDTLSPLYARGNLKISCTLHLLQNRV